MPKTIHFQERDWNGLIEIGIVALLSTTLWFQRHYMPDDPDPHRQKNARKYCERRLRTFREHGLIESIKLSIDTPEGPRRSPSVHRLLPKGADLVEDERGIRPPRPARSDPPSPATLHHRVGVVASILTVLDASKIAQLPTPEIILEQDLSPEANGKIHAPAHERYLLREAWTVDNRRVTCRPDACILIPFLTGHWLAAYIEYDRSTETEKEIQAKLPGYHMLFHPSSHLYRKHWPQCPPDRLAACVLFIVPSKQRRDNIASSLRGRPGSQYVRIAVNNTLRPESLLTSDMVWQDVNGKAMVILPSS